MLQVVHLLQRGENVIVPLVITKKERKKRQSHIKGRIRFWRAWLRLSNVTRATVAAYKTIDWPQKETGKWTALASDYRKRHVTYHKYPTLKAFQGDDSLRLVLLSLSLWVIIIQYCLDLGMTDGILFLKNKIISKTKLAIPSTQHGTKLRRGYVAVCRCVTITIVWVVLCVYLWSSLSPQRKIHIFL